MLQGSALPTVDSWLWWIPTNHPTAASDWSPPCLAWKAPLGMHSLLGFISCLGGASEVLSPYLFRQASYIYAKICPLSPKIKLWAGCTAHPFLPFPGPQLKTSNFLEEDGKSAWAEKSRLLEMSQTDAISTAFLLSALRALVSDFVQLALEARLHETWKPRGTKTRAVMRAWHCGFSSWAADWKCLMDGSIKQSAHRELLPHEIDETLQLAMQKFDVTTDS